MSVLPRRRLHPAPPPHEAGAKTRGLRRDDGAVALEFALIAPFFLLVALGAMVFALYFAATVAVVHSAAEGARASVVGLDAAERENLAKARVSTIFQSYRPLLDPTQATVTTQAGSTAGTFQVRVSYPLTALGLGGFWSFLNKVTGSSTTAPANVARTVIVANGGY